jgi:alpha-beta hydrolase superfamily lysophospholipase
VDDHERLTVPLGDDEEGRLIATLVRRSVPESERAVLMLPGLADYFFQDHVATRLVEEGWSVYGLDPRRYGRSLLPGQTANFCRDVAEYYPELDAAVARMADDGVREVLVWAHSTGGLVACSWIADRRPAGVRGLFLNSPLLRLPVPWVVRGPLLGLLRPIARRFPKTVVSRRGSTLFAEFAHRDWQGEWDYDLRLKPAEGYPITLGWLTAVRSAHARVRRGLGVPLPILVGCSARSFRAGRDPREKAAETDVVLDVDAIRRIAPRLGDHVTVVGFPGAMHDLTLSAKGVRDDVLTRVVDWAAGSVFRAGHRDARPPRRPAGPAPQQQ